MRPSQDRGVDVIEVVPGLHLLPLRIANAWLWRDADGATLVDTGPPGSGPAVAAALRSLGLPREDVGRVVLPHFHDDHAGSAAEIASWAGAEVVVGRADAPFVRGDVSGPPPSLTAAEQALHASSPLTWKQRRPVRSTRTSTTGTSWTSPVVWWCSACRATPRAASPCT